VIPVPPADACPECILAVTLKPLAWLPHGTWKRPKFPTWDAQAHWVFRGDLNKAVDVRPHHEAPCGATFSEAA
jgi:hypothetical protein